MAGVSIGYEAVSAGPGSEFGVDETWHLVQIVEVMVDKIVEVVEPTWRLVVPPMTDENDEICRLIVPSFVWEIVVGIWMVEPPVT